MGYYTFYHSVCQAQITRTLGWPSVFEGDMGGKAYRSKIWRQGELSGLKSGWKVDKKCKCLKETKQCTYYYDLRFYGRNINFLTWYYL
jgi:hypothetical protein